MTETFFCVRCGETFTKAWSDRQSDAERRRNFPHWKKQDCSLVCGDCYKLLRKLFRR